MGKKYFWFENSSYAKSVTVKEHYHNAFELYYLEKGTCNYFIDDKSYEVREGDLIFIPERVIHNTSYAGELHSRKLIYCSGHFIPESVRERLFSLGFVYRSPLIAKEAGEIFARIESEYKSSDEFSEGIIESQTNLLFFLLARCKSEDPPSVGGSTYVTRAVEYVRKNYASEVSLSVVAREISVSYEYLSRIFKSETGMGFSKYLTLVRLRRAEELLKGNEKMSVSEIAYACGFSDSNYFSEKFKRYCGVPPTKYRVN